MKDDGKKSMVAYGQSEAGEEDSRRKALRTLVSSAAIAGAATSTIAWQKPLVRSVMLPAHGDSSAKTRTNSLEDPCVLQIQCIEGGIRVNGSGQVAGPGNLNNIQIVLDVTLNGNTVQRTTQTTANGQVVHCASGICAGT